MESFVGTDGWWEEDLSRLALSLWDAFESSEPVIIGDRGWSWFCLKLLVCRYPSLPSLGLWFFSIPRAGSRMKPWSLPIVQEIWAGKIKVWHYSPKPNFLLFDMGLLIPTGPTSQGCQEIFRLSSVNLWNTVFPFMQSCQQVEGKQR